MVKNYKISEPFFEYGPKCYMYGETLVEMAKGLDKLAEKYNVDVILDIPDTEIYNVAKHVKRVHVYSQHMDSIPVGRGMGRTLPEAVKEAGAVGVMLNHAEHKLTIEEIEAAIKRGDYTTLDKISDIESGEFVSEIFGDEADELRRRGGDGGEFGATTGRPRRCGWLDLVALKYAVMMNGVTGLIMMKSDILNDFDTIKVAVGYQMNGKQVDYFPYEADDSIEPIYREFPGWNCDICNVRNYDEFPAEFKEYVEFIEKETGVPVKIISVGPDRAETIIR